MTSVFRPLVTPFHGFSSPESLRIPPAVLLLALFFVYTLGQRVLNEFYRNPDATILQVEGMRRQVDRFMTGAPAAARERALRQSVSRFTGEGSAMADAVSTVLPGALLLLYVLETGALLSLSAQFLGGEVRDGDSHSGRRLLPAYVFIPLAVRKLAAGALVWLQDPGNIRNASSFEAYREHTELSFSLLSYAGLEGVSQFPRYILYLLSDPFYLWSAGILVFGFAAVYRVRPRAGAVAAAGVTAALAFNESLLETIGLAAVTGHVL